MLRIFYSSIFLLSDVSLGRREGTIFHRVQRFNITARWSEPAAPESGMKPWPCWVRWPCWRLLGMRNSGRLELVFLKDWIWMNNQFNIFNIDWTSWMCNDLNWTADVQEGAVVADHFFFGDQRVNLLTENLVLQRPVVMVGLCSRYLQTPFAATRSLEHVRGPAGAWGTTLLVVLGKIGQNSLFDPLCA